MDGKSLIKLFEPCPIVEWASELKGEKEFLINSISAHNDS
jgi:hypothetical protein